MAWDIHGNVLRSGHCEVHPWVHEEYPCGVCYADNQRYEAQKQKEEAYWAEQERLHWEEQWKQMTENTEGSGI